MAWGRSTAALLAQPWRGELSCHTCGRHRTAGPQSGHRTPSSSGPACKDMSVMDIAEPRVVVAAALSSK